MTKKYPETHHREGQRKAEWDAGHQTLPDEPPSRDPLLEMKAPNPNWKTFVPLQNRDSVLFSLLL